MGLTLRRGKGSALTHDELDDNFAEELNQAGHAFSVGDVVYRSGSSAWTKAQADAAGTLADGIVVDVEDSDNCSIVTKDGTVVGVTAHGLGATGTVIYLSQGTAGDMTPTKPTSGYIQPIGRVIDANNMVFRIGLTSEFV